MKKNIVAFTAISFCLIALSFQDGAGDGCTSVAIKNKTKDALKPEFDYDASKTTYLVFMPKKQFKELEVPLYIGEKYRFVFNTEALPQDIDIEIYDKKYEVKDRKLLFSSRDKQAVDKQYVFEPGKSMRKIYIDYLVPPATGDVSKGCVIMTVGYKTK